MTSKELEENKNVQNPIKQWLASKGAVYTDEEVARDLRKLLYPTKEEIEEKIKILKEGPTSYLMETDIGEPVWVTQEEMIERAKKRICSQYFT